MSTWIIPFVAYATTSAEVEADTYEEAVEKAFDKVPGGLPHNTGFDLSDVEPDETHHYKDGEYVDTSAKPVNIDAAIARYATVLQHVYDGRTAGDGTFFGILAEFVRTATGKTRECDTCSGAGRVQWMSEGDPNRYVEVAEDGTMECCDCAGVGRA